LATVGLASIAAAPFGAPATCLAAITSAMCADEVSHPDPARRYWSATLAGVFYCVFAVFTGLLIAFAAQAPAGLMAGLAGIALLPVMGNAVATALGNPSTREAAVITFALTASGMFFLGLGAPVWGLIVGGGVYLLRRLPKLG